MVLSNRLQFDIVIRLYDPDHAPVAENVSIRRRRKLDDVDKGSISTLFKLPILVASIFAAGAL